MGIHEIPRVYIYNPWIPWITGIPSGGHGGALQREAQRLASTGGDGGPLARSGEGWDFSAEGRGLLNEKIHHFMGFNDG